VEPAAPNAMPSPLTILCTTRGEERILPFLLDMQMLAERILASFVLIADGRLARDRLLDSLPMVSDVTIVVAGSAGRHVTVAEYVAGCRSDYCVFLDDDERVTPALELWLEVGSYRASPTWLLPRAWLYPTRDQYITSAPHWPDYQHRVGQTAVITVPTAIHGGWIARDRKPALAPDICALEHHKLLLRSREEREATMREYEAVRHGAGQPRFYLPEERAITTATWAPVWATV